MWQSVGLTLLVIVATLACVLLFMLCVSTMCFALRHRKEVMVSVHESSQFTTATLISPYFPALTPYHGTTQRSWYVVWQLFLSKFKFLRELIGDTGSQQGDNEPSESEAEQETPPTPQRGRQKSARQRRAPAEEAT
ncbi:small integral membrane protein 13 isoform X1 [Lepidochelys kempii]|uniref:small integral membrane protein 13 isoform X1 n=1 Tax=Lepidochelys kempii TaxID=8472 RepID=UPI003C7016E5